MISDAVQNLSSDIVIISIALLGVNFLVVALVWRKFVSSIMKISIYWRKQYLKVILVFFVIPVLLPVTAFTVVGVYYPSLARNSALLVLMLVAAILFLYSLFKAIGGVINRIRRIKEPSMKLDGNILICFECMICLGLSVFCSLFALLGASSTALGIYIHENQVESFNWSRWVLNDAILLFVIGVVQMGYLYLLERRSRTN